MSVPPPPGCRLLAEDAREHEIGPIDGGNVSIAGAEEGCGSEHQDGTIHETGEQHGNGGIDRCHDDAVRDRLPPSRNVPRLNDTAVEIKIVRHHSRPQNADRYQHHLLI